MKNGYGGALIREIVMVEVLLEENVSCSFAVGSFSASEEWCFFGLWWCVVSREGVSGWARRKYW